MISEFVSMTSKTHVLFCSIFYIFAINIFNENEFIISQQRYENKWYEKMKNNNQHEFVTQSIQFVFFAIFCRRQYVNILSIDFLLQNLQSIKTRRLIKIRKIQIRKIWNNIRLRNRYRFVVFVFILFCSKNRSIHYINLQIFFASIEIKIFNKIFNKVFNKIFILVAYILFFSLEYFLFSIYLFTFIAFVMKFSTSIIIKQIFESQSMNFFAMSIDKKNE